MAFDTLIFDPSASDTLVLDAGAADWLVLEVYVAPDSPAGGSGFIWFTFATGLVGYIPEATPIAEPVNGRVGYLPEWNNPEYVPASGRIEYTIERAEQCQN